MLWVKPLRRLGLLGHPTAIYTSFHTTAAWTSRKGFLSKSQLDFRLKEAMMSQDTPELAVIYLINHYKFDPHILKAIFEAKGLEGSFSNVKYNQIAPFVGLDPSEHLQDAPTLTMQRARIPDFFFRKIVMDIDGIMMQYGPPMNHKNAEVRYRTLAPLFNRTTAFFHHLIHISPTSIINSFMPECTILAKLTKDSADTKFRACGVFNVVYIVVTKLEVGAADEHLDDVAQLIAEVEGCDYANRHLGFGAFPIYGILCNGKSFEFFCFDPRTKPPTFSRYHHSSPPAQYALSLADLSGPNTVVDFLTSLRRVSETFLYFLLLGYITGIRAQLEYRRSCLDSGKTQKSMALWQTANCLAEKALQHAITATDHATAGNYIQADKVAKVGFRKLKASIAAAPCPSKLQGAKL